MRWVLVVLLLVIWYFCSTNLRHLIHRLGSRRSLPPLRIKVVERLGRLMLALLFSVLLVLLLDVDAELGVFVSSVFAVIGVALFAQWSMLSNITASFIIFFAFPYRVGDRVRVVDKDDDICGRIEDIGVFHVMIRRDNQDLITYPNTLILQKAVIRLAEVPDGAED